MSFTHPPPTGSILSPKDGSHADPDVPTSVSTSTEVSTQYDHPCPASLCYRTTQNGTTFRPRTQDLQSPPRRVETTRKQTTNPRRKDLLHPESVRGPPVALASRQTAPSAQRDVGTVRTPALTSLVYPDTAVRTRDPRPSPPSRTSCSCASRRSLPVDTDS